MVYLVVIYNNKHPETFPEAFPEHYRDNNRQELR